MAKSLGISTEGKSREQLLDEINKKLAELTSSLEARSG
jgi:sec-independent protein translocase protein TatA